MCIPCSSGVPRAPTSLIYGVLRTLCKTLIRPRLHSSPAGVNNSAQGRGRKELSQTAACAEKAMCCPDQSFLESPWSRRRAFLGGYERHRLMEALAVSFLPRWALAAPVQRDFWEQGASLSCLTSRDMLVFSLSSVNIQGRAAWKDHQSSNHRTCGKVQAALHWAATACSNQLRLSP